MENILYYILGGIVVIALLVTLVTASIAAGEKICENRKNIKYYKMEISRSDNEQEKKHWEKKLRIERMKCIPFVCWIVKR